MNVALVHDWLTGMRGGEKCLEQLCNLWPQSRIYTLLHKRNSVAEAIERLPIRTSFLNRLPGIYQYYRYFLPLMPWAAQWKIGSCDLLFSLSHCVAKSALPPPGIPHICYCFSPMRYVWDMHDAYFQDQQHGLKAQLRNILLQRLKNWDGATAHRVTDYIAISATIQERIKRCYGRESTIIYPPVDTHYYQPGPARRRENYYLIVSALAPYKRFDLAVEACRRLGRKLLVIGEGPQRKKLQALADHHVTFLGYQPDHLIREHYQRCQALLFPALEDFGIVPVEAMACGTPVIAYGQGGARETVLSLEHADQATGVLFAEQTVDSCCAAIEQFERSSFSDVQIRQHAEKFARRYFTERIQEFVRGVLRRA